MDFTNFWFSKKAGGGVDPNAGDPIGQSLRFRGTARMDSPAISGSSASLEWSKSFWIKRGNKYVYSGSCFQNTAGYPNGWWNNSIEAWSCCNATDSSYVTGTTLQRDYSAWYHFYFKKSSDTPEGECYINGVKYLDSSIYWMDGESIDWVGYSNTSRDFYLADYHFITGQALEPTAFGRFNENGVWVPVNPDFSQNSVQTYSDYVRSSSGNWYASTTLPKTMFDGDLNTYCQTDVASGSITWVPNPPIEYQTSVRFNAINSAGDSVRLNDGPADNYGDGNGFAWKTLVTGSGTIEKIEWTGGYGGTVAAIEVDGQILTNPYLWSADLYTSPSSDTIPVNPTDQDFNTDGTGYDQSDAFNGDNSTGALSDAGSGSWIQFRPSVSITAKESLVIRLANTETIAVNGIDTGLDQQSNSLGDVDLSSSLSFPFDIETISIRGRDLNNPRLCTLIVDGQEITNGINNSYGASGWHLDFSDPNDIGRDVSGNGNHFTNISGFDTAPVGIFSSMLVDPPGGYEGPRPPTAMFDGDTSTWAQTLNLDGELDFRPTTPIPYNTLEYYTYGANWTLTQDDNTVTTGGDPGVGSAWATITTTPGTIKRLVFANSNPAGSPAVAAIRINGNIILVDNRGTNYDVMQDSPTQNWATLNPNLPSTDPYFSGNYSNANQIAGGSGTAYATSGNTIHIPTTGKWYAEVELINTASYNNSYIGIASEDTNVGNTPGAYFWGMNSGGEFFNGSTDFSLGTYENAEEGDIVGIAFDSDTNLVQMYKNGVLNYSGTASNGIEDYKDRLIFLSRPYYYSGQTLGINFGQRPFVYSPPDEGYLPLQTQNLPEAPIANGRDHFQAIEALGSGSGGGPNQIIGGYSITWSASGDGFGNKPPVNAFSADVNDFLNNNTGGQTITWNTSSFNLVGELTISQRTGSGSYRMVIDGVEVIADITLDGSPSDYTVTVNNPQSIVWEPTTGGGGIYIYNFMLDGKNLRDGSILAIAQQTFPEGMWWIKDRENVNQHQLVDSIRGSSQVSTMPNNAWAAYDIPTGACAGWLWSAPDVMDQTTRESGTINVTEGRINPTSGFSMVTYTGNNTAGSTIAHGLGAAPKMIITHGAPDQPAVYHAGTNSGVNPEQYRFRLSGSQAQGASTTFWNDTAPDDQFFTVGTDTAMNHALPYIAYCWTEVPGFSSFGHYTGNGNDTEGPMIYTGFRPAFIMYKRSDIAGNWVIHDTTRNPTNPVFLRLVANSDGNEGNAETMKVDILSNGFKHKNSDGDLNANGNQYIYCAWAENPFQSPVTAR